MGPVNGPFFHGFIDEVYVYNDAAQATKTAKATLCDELSSESGITYYHYNPSTHADAAPAVESYALVPGHTYAKDYWGNSPGKRLDGIVVAGGQNPDLDIVALFRGDLTQTAQPIYGFVHSPWTPATTYTVESLTYGSNLMPIDGGFDVKMTGYNYAKSKYGSCQFTSHASSECAEAAAESAATWQGIGYESPSVTCASTGASQPSIGTANYLNPCAVASTETLKYKESVLELEGDQVFHNVTVGGSVAEGSDLSLSCPAGTVLDKVIFASYGKPHNKCDYVPETTTYCDGSTSTAECDVSGFSVNKQCDSDISLHKPAYFSVDVVEQSCLGKESCVISADPTVWGDPCPGKEKWLSVSMRCSDRFSTKDFVTADGVLPLLGDGSAYTFGLWMFPYAKAALQSVVSFGSTGAVKNRAVLQYDGAAQTFFYYDDCINDVIFTSGAVAADTWVHVFVTMDAANEGRLYLDSKPAGKFTSSCRPDTSATGTLILGMDPNDDGVQKEHFAGMIDEFAVYSSAIPAADIDTAYTAWEQLSATPVAYYEFNEYGLTGGVKDPLVVKDTMGNADGTLSSASLASGLYVNPEYKLAAVDWYPPFVYTVSDTTNSVKEYLASTGALKPGTNLTVAGLNFLPVETTVEVDGVAVAATYVSDEVFEITSAAAEGTVTVGAKNPSGKYAAATCAATGAYVQEDLLEDLSYGLCSFYPFYYGATDDISGNGYAGAVSGGVPTFNRNQHPDEAFLLSVDDTLTVEACNATKITVAAWVQIDGTVLPSFTPCTGFGASDCRTMFDSWKFVAMTGDLAAGTYTYYINGAASASDEGYGTILLSLAGGSLSGVSGVIDDVWIYSRILSASEIELLYSAEEFSLEFGSGASVTIPRDADVASGNHGLLVTYTDMSGSAPYPTMQDVLPTVDASFGVEGPSGMAVDAWKATYTGYLYSPKSKQYTFTAEADDGVKLTVNNVVVMDDLAYTGADLNRTGTIYLMGGEWYPIEFEYKDASGSAGFRLIWNAKGMGEEVIPTAFLKAATGPFSAAMWVKAYTTGGVSTILGQPLDDGKNGLAVGIRDGAVSVSLHVGATAADEKGQYREFHATEATIEANEWVFVAVSYDGKKIQVFLDGHLRDFETYETEMHASETSMPMYLGMENMNSALPGVGGDNLYEGLLHSFMLFNSTVTETQLQAVMASPVKAASSDMVYHLPLDEGLGLVGHHFSAEGVYTNATITPASLDGSYEFWVDTTCPIYGTGSHEFAGTGLSEAIAGRCATFAIQTYDIHSMKSRTGGEVFKVTMNHARESGVSNVLTMGDGIVDNGDGSYSVTYNLTVAGQYSVLVDKDGATINSFYIYVHPDSADPLESYLTGTPHFLAGPGPVPIPQEFPVETTTTFQIQAVDKFGNTLTSGGETDFTVTFVDGPVDFTGAVIDNGDGTYKVAVHPQVVGSYKMALTMCGTTQCESSSGADIYSESQPGRKLQATDCKYCVKATAGMSLNAIVTHATVPDADQINMNGNFTACAWAMFTPPSPPPPSPPPPSPPPSPPPPEEEATDGGTSIGLIVGPVVGGLVVVGGVGLVYVRRRRSMMDSQRLMPSGEESG